MVSDQGNDTRQNQEADNDAHHEKNQTTAIGLVAGLLHIVVRLKFSRDSGLMLCTMKWQLHTF